MALLDPDRLFPLEPRRARLARALYAEVARPADHQPARPHRPALVRRERALPRPGAALRRPRPLRLPHALLAGRAARPTSACRAPTAARPRPTAARSGAASPRTTTCLRGTPSRLWLDHTFETVFGLDRRLSAATADPPTTTSPTAWPGPEFRPRALFERFGIEVIATTESPLDDLRWHRDDPRLRLGRPGGHRLPPRRGGRPRVRRLRRQRRAPRRAHRLRHRAPGTATWRRTACAAPSSRRIGATSTDHGHPTARTEDLPQAEAAALFARALAGAGDARGGRRLPRPHADRDGAHEPRRRAGAADPPRLVPQPLRRGPSPASAATRASTSRPAPTTCAR